MKTSKQAGRWLTLLVGLLSLLPLFASEPPLSKEYQVKAAFLYNFTRFIEWPTARLPKPSDPIVIGVLRAKLLGDELTRLVQGRLANGRNIVVKVIAGADEARDVHLLFVPTGEEHLLQDAESALKEASVATVGESERFQAQNGMIVFVHAADNVRFTINLAAADRAGLKFSSQLLKLATDVRR